MHLTKVRNHNRKGGAFVEFAVDGEFGVDEFGKLERDVEAEAGAAGLPRAIIFGAEEFGEDLLAVGLTDADAGVATPRRTPFAAGSALSVMLPCCVYLRALVMKFCRISRT